MLGLVQRWGEVFPRWMISLAGRRVPIALALIPASFESVLMVVGGLPILDGLGQMIANTKANGIEETYLVREVLSMLGPIALFPVRGTALAVETPGYYYRRHNPCFVCCHGVSGGIERPNSSYQ